MNEQLAVTIPRGWTRHAKQWADGPTHSTVWLSSKALGVKCICTTHTAPQKMIHISVSGNSLRHKPTWAQLQQVKNELLGKEVTGFQCFPAESRMVDIANVYHIWVFSDSLTAPLLELMSM